MYDHGGMNRAYRLIWNRAKGRWVVAPEATRRGGGAVGAVALAGLIAAAGSARAEPAATALPTGGQVVAGSVSIGANGSSMTVGERSPRSGFPCLARTPVWTLRGRSMRHELDSGGGG